MPYATGSIQPGLALTRLAVALTATSLVTTTGLGALPALVAGQDAYEAPYADRSAYQDPAYQDPTYQDPAAYQDPTAYQVQDSLEARVWLDRGAEPVVERGDEVRVYYRTSHDAYAAIFRIDTDGRISLLYPQHPGAADSWVVGGRDYRLVFRDGSRWRVREDPGVGYFFMVASEYPLDFSALDFDPDSGWDLRGVGQTVYEDPYVAIDDYVAAILPSWETTPYALDFLEYSVGEDYDYPRFLCYDCHGFQRYSRWDPYAHACSSYRVVIWDDPYFRPRFRYYGTRVVFARPLGPRPRYSVTARLVGSSPRPLVRTRQAPPRRTAVFKESPRGRSAVAPGRAPRARAGAPRDGRPGTVTRARPSGRIGGSARRAPGAGRATARPLPSARRGIPPEGMGSRRSGATRSRGSASAGSRGGASPRSRERPTLQRRPPGASRRDPGAARPSSGRAAPSRGARPGRGSGARARPAPTRRPGSGARRPPPRRSGAGASRTPRSGGRAAPSRPPRSGGRATPSRPPRSGGRAAPSRAPRSGGRAAPSRPPRSGGRASPSRPPRSGGRAAPGRSPRSGERAAPGGTSRSGSRGTDARPRRPGG